MGLDILILTDSLALPRLEPEFCHQKDTWPALLRAQGHRVTQVSIGGGTAYDLAIQCNYYRKETLDLDLVIVQSGIVDCAPRFAGKMEIKLYKVLPLVGKWIIKLLNRNWVRKVRNITYLKPKKYEQNIQRLKQTFHPYPVYFLGILPAQPAYEKQLQGITKNTLTYNRILEQTGTFINLSGIPPEGIMKDYHHLNKIGHRFVVEQLQPIIAAQISPKVKD